MTEFITEQPIVSKEGLGLTEFITEQPAVSEKGPMRELARRVAEWICTQPISPSQSSPAPRGHVAGVYGARGSGKTSFLFMLLAELSKCDHVSTLALPTAKRESLPRAIFRPSETRAQDGLLLLLLDHLREQYSGCGIDPDEGRSAKFEREIEKAEVLVKETRPFLEYVKDTSPSDARLEDHYVKLLRDAATATSSIRAAFAGFLTLRIPEAGRFVFLVDDVDLQPHRALELLEIVYLFMERPEVFVVLAADKPLLLRAVDKELRRRHMHRAGLGAALLAKYVPYGWPLPVPSESERLDMLSLSSPWLDDAAEKMLESARRKRGNMYARHSGSYDPDDVEWPPRDPEVISLSEAKHWFLPETYRAVKATQNAIAALDRGLLAQGSDIFSRYSHTGLRGELIPQFVLLLVMVDVRWPELQLFSSFERSVADVRDRLQALYGAASMPLAPVRAHEPALCALGVSDLALFENDVPLALFRLGAVLYSWSRLSAEATVTEHALFITFFGNADATSTFSSLWPEALMDRQAHLDLRGFAPGGRPAEGKQIGMAVERAMELLPELIGTTGRLWLGAEAPSSFLAWLGFWLDYRRPVVAVNAKTLVPVEVPGRLDPPDRGQIYTPCIREWVGEASAPKHASVIFDFFGRSASDDPAKLAVASGAPHESLCGRLLYAGGRDFAFGDVEDILLDVLELLTELRQRGVTTLHVGLVMPDVVAFALGRQLKSRGLSIVLYEFIGARYERAIVLEE